MAQLVYKLGWPRHLFAVRQLVADPNNEDCYIAGDLVGVYASTDAADVSSEATREGLVSPPYAVVHVTGYMLALARQGQEGFRVWVCEPEGVAQEQYLVSLVDTVRGSWSVRKTR